MKHPIRAAALAAGALLCFSVNQAFADIDTIDLVAVGPSNSWFAIYNIHTGSAFDKVTITAFASGTSFTFPVLGTQVTDSQFEYTSVITAASGGWSQVGAPGSGPVSATGSLTNNLQFTINWKPDAGSSVTYGVGGFSIDLYNGATVIARGDKIGTDFVDADNVDWVGSIHSVPVPAALWTGLPMLGGMILLLRRNRRNVLA